MNGCFCVLSQFGLHYVINDPAILESSSLYVNLIFTSQPFLIKFFIDHLIFVTSGVTKMQICSYMTSNQYVWLG